MRTSFTRPFRPCGETICVYAHTYYTLLYQQYDSTVVSKSRRRKEYKKGRRTHEKGPAPNSSNLLLYCSRKLKRTACTLPQPQYSSSSRRTPWRRLLKLNVRFVFLRPQKQNKQKWPKKKTAAFLPSKKLLVSRVWQWS